MKRTFNVSERVRRVSIGAECVTVGVLLEADPNRGNSMQLLVSPQSFPHLWKNLWKIANLGQGETGKAVFYWPFRRSDAGNCEKSRPLMGRKPTEGMRF
jgi:hypothetical protein